MHIILGFLKTIHRGLPVANMRFWSKLEFLVKILHLKLLER
jgi:hypothetical protein